MQLPGYMLDDSGLDALSEVVSFTPDTLGRYSAAPREVCTTCSRGDAEEDASGFAEVVVWVVDEEPYEQVGTAARVGDSL